MDHVKEELCGVRKGGGWWRENGVKVSERKESREREDAEGL